MTEDDYAWPSKGMTLFDTTGDGDWQANAQMPHRPDWVVYKSGYELAAKLLMERTASGSDQDFLIYPILFTARQAIELGLKEIILLGTRLSDTNESYPTSHDIWRLWEIARGVLATAGASLDDDTDAFESLVKQLHAADPGSMTFRYPVDKKGAPSFSVEGGQIPGLINTRDLQAVLEAMFNYLSGTRDWLEDLVETEEMALRDLSAGDEW